MIGENSFHIFENGIFVVSRNLYLKCRFDSVTLNDFSDNKLSSISNKVWLTSWKLWNFMD